MPDKPGVLVRPPLLFAGSAIAGWILDRVLPLNFLQTFGVTGWQFWLGLVILVFGLVLGLAAIMAFRLGRTNIHPHLPSLNVITDGPYKFTRNPMYVGALLGLLGLCMAASMEWLLVLLPAIAALLHFGVVLREELYLTAKFGALYTDYLARTKRWI